MAETDDRTGRLRARFGEGGPGLDATPGSDALPLPPREWLEGALDETVGWVDRLVREERAVCARGQALEARALHRGRSLQLELALVVRLVVRGPRSQVPVLWHVACAAACETWRLPTEWRARLDRELPAEIGASAVGQPLREPIHGPVVLGPWAAAQLVHECIGHTSEADNHDAYALPSGRTLGHAWTAQPLTVIDAPTVGGHRASYAVDDEGEPARAVSLVTEGRWTGLLHSQRTAAAAGAAPTGHGRRTAHAPHALPRMSVTMTLPGTESPEALVQGIDDGLYCVGTWGGGSAGTIFVVRPNHARRIRDGALTDEIVRRFDLRGDKFDALANLDGIGARTEWFEPAYGCDKFGQNGLPVSFSAPHLRLRRLAAVPIGAS